MYTCVEFIKVHDNAKLPEAATEGSVGLDLCCVEDFIIRSGNRELVSTGLKIALEDGFEAQVRSRSGLAAKHGIAVLNSPGTIDADYRGQVGVILINHGLFHRQFRAGDRVAQLVIKPVCRQVSIKEVSEFSDPSTERGEGGYGSTGS